MADFDYWELVEDFHLRFTKSADDSYASVRASVIESLGEHMELELDTLEDDALEGGTHTLIFWLADEQQSFSAYAIPNEAIDDVMRADLERLPGSFGRRSDFVPDQGGKDIVAAVRWMAALGTEGYLTDAFIDRVARPWLEGIAPDIRPTEDELRTRHQSMQKYDVWSMDPDQVFVALDGGLDRRFDRVWTVQRGT